MRYIVWVLRAIVFVIVLLFALKNTDPVTIGFVGGLSIANVPLVIALVVAFFVGAICIYLFSLSGRFAKNRQINQLKQELQNLQNSTAAAKKTMVENEKKLGEETISAPAIAAPDGFVPNK